MRSYYLGRDMYDGSESEAWALGGSVGFKSGYFRDRLALGATGYGSRGSTARDKDGSRCSRPASTVYAALGEPYPELLLGEDAQITVGRAPWTRPTSTRTTPA